MIIYEIKKVCSFKCELKAFEATLKIIEINFFYIFYNSIKYIKIYIR